MPKSLQLLIELIKEDKLDITEVLEGLGYEIVETLQCDVYKHYVKTEEEVLIGYDEVITIKKEHR